MKKKLFILFVCCNVFVSFGQNQQKSKTERQAGLISFNMENNKVGDKDSIEIIDLTNEGAWYDNPKLNNNPVFFNGKRCSRFDLAAIDKSQIESFSVIKTDTVINDLLHSVRIVHVTTNDGYDPNPVSLESIKEKYSGSQPTVIIINNEIITEDLKDYLLDEKSILQITKGRIKSLEINYMSILTRAEENIENTKGI